MASVRAVEYEQIRDQFLKSPGDVSTVVLVGDPGTGKTWMAKKLIDDPETRRLCYCTLWLSLNRKYDSQSLYENIARQLSLLPTVDEWDSDDEKEAGEERPEKSIPENWTTENLKHEISKRLEKKKKLGKHLLLVLDDEGSKMDYEGSKRDDEGSKRDKKDNLNDLNLKSTLEVKDSSLKVLITRKEKYDNSSNSENKVIDIGPMVKEDLEHLLKEIAGTAARSRVSSVHYDIIVKMSLGSPAAITMIAKALSYMAKKIPAESFQALKWALEDADAQEVALKNATRFGEASSSSSSMNVSQGVNPLILLAYQSLNELMVNCFWYCLLFFKKHGSIHYNELITLWILEGYFNPVNNVEKAYEHGHSVLMELIDRGMLKIQEDNAVVTEGAIGNIMDLGHRGFSGTANLGLVYIFDDDKANGVGRVTQIDGMIKALPIKNKKEKISTILIDGSRLRLEVHRKFFEGMKDLEVLGLFGGTFESFSVSFSTIKKLRVLVLRGCVLLKKIEDVANLEGLTALEISDASSLEEIPEELFKKTPFLQSLHLSALPIEELPESLSELSELRWLIIRRCSVLEYLPNLRSLGKLEVIDVSDNISLKSSKDKNKNFAYLHNLELLDLSHSQVERLPIFYDHKKPQNIEHLKRLLLRGCSKLTRLPNLKPLSALEILDLAGAKKLREIIADCFENKDKLRVVDLSETAISHLPSYIGNLQHLRLKGCSKLRELSCIESLVELESFDISDVPSLESLPSLSKLRNIRKLILKGCSSLKSILSMEGLINLEVLDLSGCKNLGELPLLNDSRKLEVLNLSGCYTMETINSSFEHMSRLQNLNLSETKIKSVPSLPNPSNLCSLVLKNCPNLQVLPKIEDPGKLVKYDISVRKEEQQLDPSPSAISLNVDELLSNLTELKTLNLSGVVLKDITFLSHLTNLNRLSLTIRSDTQINPVENLTELQVLKLSEVSVAGSQSCNFLSSIARLTKLSKLFLSSRITSESLKSLSSLVLLEVLDLSGSTIQEFPYAISVLTRLRRLVLPNIMTFLEADWKQIQHLPEEVSWKQCNTLELNKISVEGAKPLLTVTSTNFLQLLEEKTELWQACLKEFYICVCLLNEQGKDGARCCVRDIHVDESIYMKSRYFPYSEKHGGCLELHGSEEFSDGVKAALSKAKNISIVDNSSVSFSSILGVGAMTEVGGCWLERCTELKEVFSGEEKLMTVETLWASNLPKLGTIYNNSLEPDSFGNLKHMYIDCCPMLETLFSASQLPKNLKILRVKFCDKLKTLFDSSVPEECELPSLQLLHLVELPELRRIGVKLTSQTKLIKRGCLKLNK